MSLMSKPALTLEDVFFELFLPAFLVQHETQLHQLEACIQLSLCDQPTRHWHILTTGNKPSLHRGAPSQTPQLHIGFSPAVIERVVLGKQFSLPEALRSQEITVQAETGVLNRLAALFKLV